MFIGRRKFVKMFEREQRRHTSAGSGAIASGTIAGQHVASVRDDRIIPAPGAGGSSIIEVRIDRVVHCVNALPDEIDNCNAFGDHLRCYAVDASGFAIFVEPYIPVFPNLRHSIFDYINVQWSADNTAQPIHTVYSGVRGRTLAEGEIDLYVEPPTNICESPGGEGDGACCFQGDCLGSMSQGDCLQAGGDTWLPGALCSVGEPCPQVGACCHPTNGCVANKTFAQCSALEGDWRGPGSSCPVACQGACCLPGGGCTFALNEAQCVLQQGGIFFGVGVGCGQIQCPPELELPQIPGQTKGLALGTGGGGGGGKGGPGLGGG